MAALAFWQSAWDKKREQASKVAAWFEDEEPDTIFNARVANNSDAPIYQVTLLEGGAPIAKFHRLNPGASFEQAVHFPSIDEHARRFNEALERGDDEEAQRIADGYLAAVKRVSIGLHFRDALGRWWFRWENGRIRASRRKVFLPADR